MRLRVAAVVFLLVLLTGCAGDPSSTVSTSGATSMDKLIQSLNEQFMLDHQALRATYDPTGSGAGIQAVRDGTCDVGLSSRALKPEEAQALQTTLLALDGITVVVHPENPVADLTLAQLRGIYLGETRDWQAVGGPPGEISPIGREAGSGTREGFESVVGVGDAAYYAQELTSTGAVLESVRNNPNAIGYISLASLNDSVRAITVDGVPSGVDTIQAGLYPLQRPFLLVTRADVAPSETVSLWLDFVTGPEATSLILGAGAIPPPKEAA